jgi:arginine repressor
MELRDAVLGVEERRRLIVELLRTEIITSAAELAKAIERRGYQAPVVRTLHSDLEKVGVVRVNLGNGQWRYRTADLITVDDVRINIQDRLASDGLAVQTWTDGLIIRTTKGTAAALGGLFKMLMDYELDANIRFVMHDSDDTVMLGISPAHTHSSYANDFRAWMRPAS